MIQPKEESPPRNSKLLITWSIASVLIAILFFAHPARAAYRDRVTKFLDRFSGKAP